MSNRQHCMNMLKVFFPLLTAIALQHLLALTVNLLDNFMLGRFSEDAMTAASVVNQIQFILQEICGGIGAGVSVLGSQYWGKGEREPIKKIISVGLKLGALCGFVFFAATKLFPAAVVGLFTDDATIAALSCEYLSVMSWTYLIFGISNALMYSMQAVKSAHIGTIMSAMTICINGILNYILIFGNFGAPVLGIKGAAYATLVSRSVEFITIFVYVLFIDKKLRMTLASLLGFDFSYLGDFIKVALPVMISGAIWGIGQACQTAIMGHIGSSVIAANSIASLFMQLIGAFGMACGQASSIIMGNTVGEERYELVRPYTKTLQLVFAGLGITSGTIMFLCRHLIANAYKLSGDTKELTVIFIIIFSVSMMGSCYEYPIQGGIIAGGGNPKYQVIMDNVFIWLYTIPFAYCSAFVFEWSPVVTYIILKSDQILKCIPNSLYCNSYKWVKNLTRESRP